VASVSVRYIVLDVDASIAFYTQHLGFSVDMHPAPLFDDLAGLVDRLRQDGAHFRNEIVIGNGGKQILLEDPSGNPIELFEPHRS
jgi:catechol 2,3-dioxygenase-like lactoylglutathione lyase family enzyme